MLFLEPSPTPYDLRWTMLGIPVRVHPMFWLVSIVMGWGALAVGVEYLAIWVGSVFLSILIHELGHVWMGQAFGSHGHIVLYGFGGLAVGSNQLEERWQRILVCFAGPLAGFVFLGFLLAFLWVSNPQSFPIYLLTLKLDLGLPIEPFRREDMPHPLMLDAVNQLIFINLMWGLVNLLPVWPLDGGQISRDVCESGWPDAGASRSLGISLVVAGLLAVHCLLVRFNQQLIPLNFGGVYPAILFGLLALQSWQMMQQLQRRADPWDREDY